VGWENPAVSLPAYPQWQAGRPAGVAAAIFWNVQDSHRLFLKALDPVIESTGADPVFLAPGLVAEATGAAFPDQIYPFAFTAFWLFLYHLNPTPIFYFGVYLHCGAGRAGTKLYQTAPNSTPGTSRIGSTPSWISCLTKSGDRGTAGYSSLTIILLSQLTNSINHRVGGR